MVEFKVGDLVKTQYKNRWDIFCCGNIDKIVDDRLYITVFNYWGPGADAGVILDPKDVEKITVRDVFQTKEMGEGDNQ